MGLAAEIALATHSPSLGRRNLQSTEYLLVVLGYPMHSCHTVCLWAREALDPCRTNPRRQRGNWTTQWPITPFLLRELEIGPSARRSLPIVNTGNETFNPVVKESHFFTFPRTVDHTSTFRKLPSIDVHNGRKQRQPVCRLPFHTVNYILDRI